MPLRIDVDTTDAPPSRFGSAGVDGLAARVRAAARATLVAEAVDDASLSVTLVDDRTIADLNARYRGHEGPTDVLAFALHDPREAPVGDVYIGHAQASRQARRLGVEPAEELVRLTVHGTLHVLGHEHPPDEAREASAMWVLQERIVREVMEAKP